MSLEFQLGKCITGQTACEKCQRDAGECDDNTVQQITPDGIAREDGLIMLKSQA